MGSEPPDFVLGLGVHDYIYKKNTSVTLIHVKGEKE